MKKVFLFLLVGVMTFTFAACGGEQQNDFSHQQSDTNLQENETIFPTDDTLSSLDKSEEYVSPVDLRLYSVYNEGLAWAIYNNEQVCIDKQGKIVFKLPNGYYFNQMFLYGFNNGIAVIIELDQANQMKLCLCREDGTIIKPEDVGATEFAVAPSRSAEINWDMFHDGYILAYNSVYDDNGALSAMEAGILSPKMEWIVPLSNSFYNTIMPYNKMSLTYHSGYILALGDKYLDLRTGRESKDFSELYFAPDVEYVSDFWVGCSGNPCDVYDDRDGAMINRESVLDLSGYGMINRDFTFVKGIAPVVLGQESECKFTLLREDGSLCFEPVRIKDDYQISYDSEMELYLVSQISTTGHMVLDIFDVTGKVKSHTLDVSEYTSSSASLSDGVIWVVSYSEENEAGRRDNLLTTDFKPLF